MGDVFFVFVFLKAKFFSFSATFRQRIHLSVSRGRAAPAWLQTGLFMAYVAVVGVWLIAGSQDVGGFRWCFITLTSPFLIKSRPILSLRWVTSSICICICVCVCVCIVYTVYLIPLDSIDLDHTHTHVTFLHKLTVCSNGACCCGHVQVQA